MIRALAFLVLMAVPAAAEDLSVDPDRVYACHQATTEGERSPNCLGQASNDCQLRAGGDTTVGIIACLASETEAWDGILNDEYQNTRAAFRERDASEGLTLADGLRDAQRAWIAFRDAECGLSYAVWGGGSMRGIAHANCLMVMTAERSLALRDMRPR